jgi:O-antigen ligase
VSRRQPAARRARPPAAAGGLRRRLSAPAVAEAFLWLLVVLVPLALIPALRDPFTLPKRMLAEWLALASVLVLAAGALRAAGRPAAAWMRDARSRPAVRLVLPLLAAAVVSWLATTHRAHAAGAMADLAVAAVALVAWSGGLEATRLRRVLAVLALPAALLAVLAILQFHGVYRVFAFARGFEVGRFGVTSLAGNAGHLGAYLAIACVVLQALLPATRSALRRGALLAALALALYALVLTQTLVALAALALGSAAVWAVVLPRRRAVAALALLVVLAAVTAFAVRPLRWRVEQKVEQLAAGEVNALLTGRLDGWRAAGWMLREHPLTGAGPGAYVTEFGTAKLALLDRGTPFYANHLEPTFANAHNELLEAAAEWGLPGLAAVAWALWVVAAAVRRVGRRRGASRDAAAEAALAWGGLAVLAVLALGHFPFRLALTGYPALLWLAWVLRRSAEAPPPAGDTEAAAAEAGAAPRAGRLLGWAVVALLAAALALQTVRTRQLLRASRVLNAVERTTVQVASRGRLPPTLLWANLRLLREAAELDPASAAVHVAAGSQHLLLEQPDEAAAEYRLALALEPRPEAWLNLGRAQAAGGDDEAALASWTAAVRLDPRLIRHLPPPAQPLVQQRAAAAAGGSEG